MKIPTDVLETMRAAIAPLNNDHWRGVYSRGEFPRSETTRDVDKRYRWDLLTAALGSAWICAELYDRLDCNDRHIDTALRRIVPPLPTK